MILKNIQFQQFINLALLTIYAYYNNTLQSPIYFIALLLAYALAIEYFLQKRLNSSALVTTLGIVLMVGYLAWYIPFILITLSLLQKRYLHLANSHIFNPSNFAIIAALILFYPKALPIIGQLGYQGYFILIAVLIMASAILFRVNRFIIPIAFISFYILLEYLIARANNPYWELSHFLQQFFTTSFIVYIFFMLTDPKTTPNSIILQTLFGACVALFLVLIEYFTSPRVWNLFLALFIASIFFVPFYKKLDKKEWIKYAIYLSLSVAAIIYISFKKPIYFSM